MTTDTQRIQRVESAAVEIESLRAQRDALAAALRDVYDRTLAPTENSPAIRMIREAARAALAALEAVVKARVSIAKVAECHGRDHDKIASTERQRDALAAALRELLASNGVKSEMLLTQIRERANAALAAVETK